MNSLIAQIARWIAPQVASALPNSGVALALMERAEADAGRNPHQAQELRSAACAYLSVVR